MSIGFGPSPSGVLVPVAESVRITGATRGIGSSLAIALSKAGADLILVQRSTANTTTRDLVLGTGGLDGKGGKATIVVCDLASKSDVESLVQRAVEVSGKLDIVVNCGEPPYAARGPYEDPRWHSSPQPRGRLPDRVLGRGHASQLERSLHDHEGCRSVHQSYTRNTATNVKGAPVSQREVNSVTDCSGKHMLSAREKATALGNVTPNGKIINISSLNAYQGGHNIIAYVGAKHGVQGIVRLACGRPKDVNG